MHVKVSELRRIANAVFDEIDRNGQDEIDLTAGYYWNIPDEHLYEPTAPPPEALDLGDLASDWEELTAVGRSMNPVPSHDLRHLAALLRFVATKVLP